MTQKTNKAKEPEKKTVKAESVKEEKHSEPFNTNATVQYIKEQYRSMVITAIVIIVSVITLLCTVLFLPTKPVIEQLPDRQAELYETVVFEVQSADVFVYGPVETKAFPSNGKTYFIPRKEGVYYLFFVNAGGLVRKPCYVGCVVCGDGKPEPEPQPDPQPVAPTFQTRFRDLLLKNIPAEYRNASCPKLAEACSKVLSMNLTSEDDILENLQAEQRAALDWDNAPAELRASWFAFFQAGGPVDTLVKEIYPDKVNWNAVLSDMAVVYKSL